MSGVYNATKKQLMQNTKICFPLQHTISVPISVLDSRHIISPRIALRVGMYSTVIDRATITRRILTGNTDATLFRSIPTQVATANATANNDTNTTYNGTAALCQ
eukprot:comp19211_c0_seq1/m.35912 comp19211_c0_seq1/g.35912  ORF comp19211_c0_seq1/g.35912 comp19211_c0_seq1/m.35912 type:complete len:104 (-) comp19211_c0_seq1:61-372(-)